MKRTQFLLLLILALHLVPRICRSDDSAIPHSIVVTATRLNTPFERVASSITVISGDELAKRKSDSVAEILETVPGLRLVRSGGMGSPTSATFRGAGAEHTLVLIDGVKLNDPISPARSFDFSGLSLGEIERIEITRGPESVLYGSDAVGGVIHIITKTGQGKTSRKLGLGYGRYETLSSWAAVNGSTPQMRYAFSGKVEQSEGYSAANVTYGNHEPDGRRSVSANARLDFDKEGLLPSSLSFRYSDSAFDNDSAGGPGGDDADYASSEQKWDGSLKVRSRHAANWEPHVALSYSNILRTAHKEPNASHPEFLRTRYEASRIGAEAQNDFFLNDENTLSIGLVVDRESGESQETFGTGSSGLANAAAGIFGAFLQHQFSSDRFFGTAGVRLDHHDRFGSQGTYRIAPGYRITESGTRLKTSIGTGFKAPSLYQLYSAFGDSSLRPELSFGYDAGIEQSFLDNALQASLTYFHLSLTNLTEFEPAIYRFRNQGAVDSQGVESLISARIVPAAKLTFNHTFTYVRDQATGLPLYRRPTHQGSAELEYEILGIETSLRARATGQRDDLDAVTLQRKTMPGYWVLDLSVSSTLPWSQEKPSKLMVSLKNVLDREYEEVDGYGTPGRSLFVAYEQEF